jgi:hypothetical protein
MLNLPDLLARLARSRPVFNSEADFQHAFAWEIHFHHPDAKIRLEYRPANVQTRMYIDVWAGFPGGETAAIELKYKTRPLNVDHDGEEFRLTNQSAPDQGRYDFLCDIARLEEITAAAPAVRGAAILLSNDSTYWLPPRTARTADAAFRIHEGRVLTGELAWGATASAGTMRSREALIRLGGSYNAGWSDYSNLGTGNGRRFRYLLVSVVAGTACTEPLKQTEATAVSQGRVAVGDEVRFHVGAHAITGIVREDRGPIGVGGRRLYLIEFETDKGNWYQVELPRAEFEIVASPTRPA